MKVTTFLMPLYGATIRTEVIALIEYILSNLLRKIALVIFTTNQEKLTQNIKDTALFRVLLSIHYLPCTPSYFWVIRLNRFYSSKYDVPQKHKNYNQKITQEQQIWWEKVFHVFNFIQERYCCGCLRMRWTSLSNTIYIIVKYFCILIWNCPINLL